MRWLVLVMCACSTDPVARCIYTAPDGDACLIDRAQVVVDGDAVEWADVVQPSRSSCDAGACAASDVHAVRTVRSGDALAILLEVDAPLTDATHAYVAEIGDFRVRVRASVAPELSNLDNVMLGLDGAVASAVGAHAIEVAIPLALLPYDGVARVRGSFELYDRRFGWISTQANTGTFVRICWDARAPLCGTEPR